jgi:regulator of sigma E protease
MDFTFNGIGSFVIFLAVLNTLVFVHELGHFLTARLFKIHVEEFALGFPPRLVGLVRDREQRWRVFFGPKAPSAEELGGPRTIYSLNLLPIGGFVRPKGEDDPLITGGLASAPKRARIIVLAAGSAFNLLFAFLVFIVGFRVGWPDRVTITETVPGSPAQVVGLQAQDVILRADGVDVHYPQQITQVVYAHLGQSFELVVQRGEQEIAFTATPRREWPEGQGPLGIGMSRTMVTDYTWPQAALRAAQEIGYHFQEVVALPGRLIRREVSLTEARPIGFVGMNDLTRAAVTTAQEINQIFPVLQLVGLISVALALTNLLPLPALDGGRILFVLIEAIRGRRVDPMREGLVHLAGMVFLLALMVVITYQDIVNPIFPR